MDNRSNNASTHRYIILVRHGPAERPTELKKFKQSKERGLYVPQKDDEDSGEKIVLEVASSFSDVVNDTNLQLCKVILSGTHEISKQTADVFKDVINRSTKCRVSVVSKPFLDPERVEKYREDKTSLQCIAEKIDQCISKCDSANTLVIVGHMPMLGWLAFKLTGRTVAIPGSGMACLRARRSGQKWHKKVGRKWPPIWREYPRYNLQWVIEPSDSKIQAELKEKIQSKMDLAKILGGFIVAVTVFLAKAMLDDTVFSCPFSMQDKLLVCSAGVYFVSAAFYFATLYAYDRLLMPTRFWGEKPGNVHREWLARRPPSSSDLILQQNMVRVWNRLFVPATMLVFLGTALLISAAMRPIFDMSDERYACATLIAIVIAAGCFTFLYRSFRPVLGTDD